MTSHIVIVGGSSGIGLATAARLLGTGARVTIAARDEAKLAGARREFGHDVRTVAMDATATAELPRRFEEIGPFEHLVLALGSDRGVGPFETLAMADVRRGFEEKTYAHIATAQAALPTLDRSGSITFVSAVSARAAVAGTAGIGAANAAIAALVPILAVELAPRRVNAVLPGVVDTPWWGAMPEDRKRATFADFAAKTPVARVGRPDDVAKAIAFLIDDDFITGEALICDGGLRLTA